jgi:glycosyltransferase involved in cell wall biosynthesis
MHNQISACVMTYNEEGNIRRCLESLTWCDEIVILDSFSTDRTVEICLEFTRNVHQHEWLGYIGQRNLIRTMANHDWVLFLDADEVVSPELHAALEAQFDKLIERYVGFAFPRLVFYLGRWIRHGSWYPDYNLRLFRKEKGRSGGAEPHDTVFIDGPTMHIRHPILHYTYNDITDHVNTMNRFSSISAQSMHDRGRRFHWVDLLFRPAWSFFKGFVLRLGFIDGWRGFLIATVNAFGVAMKYAKLREIRWIEKHSEPSCSAEEDGLNPDS